MMLRGRWVSPLLVIIVCGVLGLGIGVFRDMRAEGSSATATVYVRPPVSGNPSDAVQGEYYSRNQAQLIASLVPRSGLQDRVEKKMRADGSRSELATVTATAPQDAGVVNIVVEGTSTESVHDTTTALLAVLPDYAKEVRGSSGLEDGPVITTVQQSEVAGPSWFSRIAGLAVWTLCGAGLGWALVWGIAWRRGVIRDGDAAAKASGEVSTVCFDARDSADRADTVAAQLFAIAGASRSLVLVGARSGDGAAAVAADLAVSFGTLGRTDVRVIDSLLEHPGALSGEPGAVVLVASKGRTVEKDLRLAAAICSGNGAGASAVLVVSGRRGSGPSRTGGSSDTPGYSRAAGGSSTVVRDVNHGAGERDWPVIDAFEDDSATVR